MIIKWSFINRHSTNTLVEREKFIKFQSKGRLYMNFAGRQSKVKDQRCRKENKLTVKCWSIQYEPPSSIHIAAIPSSVSFDLDETFRYSDNIPPDPFFNSVFLNNRRLRQNNGDLLHPIRHDFFYFFTVSHRRSFSHCNAFSIVRSLNDFR